MLAICGHAEVLKSPEHLLRSCPFAAAVWFLSPYGLRMHEEPRLPFLEWCQEVLHSLPKDLMDLFLTLMWVMWKARKAVWNGLKDDRHSVTKKQKILMELSPCAQVLSMNML